MLIKKLKSKNDFEEIFNSGRIVYSSDNRFRAHYLVSDKINNGEIFIAASVSKKSGSGVWRNRVKRLLREAFHHTNNILTEFVETKNLLIKIVITPNIINQDTESKISLGDILPDVVEILTNIRNRLS